MLTLEQYRNGEMAALYHNCIAAARRAVQLHGCDINASFCKHGSNFRHVSRLVEVMHD